MRVKQGKFGNYFELDIKNDKTEEFFESLEETLLRASGSCLGKKPWNIKSPLINYGGFYTVRCKIYPNSHQGNLLEGMNVAIAKSLLTEHLLENKME